MEQNYDWTEVVERQPKGYLELNDGRTVRHGPIKSIKIDGGNNVVIDLKWTAGIKLDLLGIPVGEWQAVVNQPIIFPNFLVPFVFEDTPEKGERVRFGLNILYLGEVKGLDPHEVRGLDDLAV